VRVHRDGPDIACEYRVRAVGREGHVLACVGAVELQRVGAGVALDDVAAVARVPSEHVVTGTQVGGIAADVAVDEVVAAAAQQNVVAIAAAQRVVTRAAVQCELGQGADAVQSGEGVVSRTPLDQQVFDVGDVDDGSATGEDRCAGSAVAGDVDDVVATGAVGGDAVFARS